MHAAALHVSAAAPGANNNVLKTVATVVGRPSFTSSTRLPANVICRFVFGISASWLFAKGMELFVHWRIGLLCSISCKQAISTK
jgi:hypothetical protein